MYFVNEIKILNIALWEKTKDQKREFYKVVLPLERYFVIFPNTDETPNDDNEQH